MGDWSEIEEHFAETAILNQRKDSLPRTWLDQLADQCSACRQCPHGATATQSVFSKGDPLSPLAFVGEAPGEDEDREGLPFVGDSGLLLDRMIERMRKEAEQLGITFPIKPYICNVVKHRPPGNKLMKKGEDVEACKQWLFEQLRLLPNIRVIVSLGRVASQTLLGCGEAIGSLRGHLFHNSRAGDQLVWREKEDLPSSSEWLDSNRRIFIVPTWHPSYLLRQPNRMEPRQQCWSDLQLALGALNE